MRCTESVSSLTSPACSTNSRTSSSASSRPPRTSTTCGFGRWLNWGWTRPLVRTISESEPRTLRCSPCMPRPSSITATAWRPWPPTLTRSSSGCTKTTPTNSSTSRSRSPMADATCRCLRTSRTPSTRPARPSWMSSRSPWSSVCSTSFGRSTSATWTTSAPTCSTPASSRRTRSSSTSLSPTSSSSTWCRR